MFRNLPSVEKWPMVREIAGPSENWSKNTEPENICCGGSKRILCAKFASHAFIEAKHEGNFNFFLLSTSIRYVLRWREKKYETAAMTQNKKTQERLPNRRNEINTFSVFRLAFLRTWTSFYHSLFSLVFFRLIWMSLCEWKCEYVRAMFFVCLFVRFHTIVLHRGKVDTSTWRFRNRVSLLLLVVCAFFFLLFFGEIALSFIFLCSSQFSPICAGWCLDDGNEAHTHSREEKKRETKSNKWKKVERKQNCDGFYLPYCMCGDRSVAWEWSNSHVYWAFNRCVLFFLCCFVFISFYVARSFNVNFLFVKLDEKRLRK